MIVPPFLDGHTLALLTAEVKHFLIILRHLYIHAIFWYILVLFNYKTVVSDLYVIHIVGTL